MWYEGVWFPSVECAYQAAKFPRSIWHRFQTIDSSDAKRLGRSPGCRADWDDIKLEVMYELLREKFRPGSRMARWLLMSGDMLLEETNWWHDYFWGVCNGRGQNWLGRLLMEIRDELQWHPFYMTTHYRELEILR